MYFQITTRCNMTCAHCGFACTSKGEDMSEKVFNAALKLAEEYGSYVSIGGGEPTVHPKFWQFLINILASDVEGVWLATNGKKTKIALKLAKLAKKEIIDCELSQDEYHEDIDYEVVEVFTQMKKIRNSTQFNEPISAGRCDWGVDKCICPTVFIKPNGDIHQCGCEDSPKIGDVFDGFECSGFEFNECYKNLELSEV